jgi:hypothetical protein
MVLVNVIFVIMLECIYIYIYMEFMEDICHKCGKIVIGYTRDMASDQDTHA